MAEYSRIAKGHFTSTGSSQVINLPFQPDRIEMINYSVAAAAATSQAIARAYWDISMGQGFAVVEGYNATPALIFDVVTTGGFSSYSAGLSLQYGPLVLLGGSGGIAKTNATTLTVTTTAPHGLTPGNVVVFQNLYATTTTGMQQLAGIPFEVLTVGTAPSTTFTVGWNGTASNLTAITAGGTGTAGFKQVLYPDLYAPGVSIPWAISLTAGVVTVSTTAPHNYKVGQEIGFSIPTIYGAGQINEINSPLIPSSPQYFYLTAVTKDTFTFNYSGTLTTFALNAPFLSFPGLQFPLVRAVGDVNTGGGTYAGANLYPAPLLYNGFSQNLTSTINGPAIQGAFVNNTSQGFIIGSGAGTVLTTASLVGANANVIYWAAYYSDIAIN